jgi:hypothetical protein
MLAPSLLRAGLALKLNQVKLAARSYLRDRTSQAAGTLASYAIAIGFFAAAGAFLIAACLVGVTALFRWIEINYGLFPAFGAVGALLLVLAAICAAVAASKLKRRSRHFPTLSSRMRVAVKAGPIMATPIEATSDTAAAALRDPSAPAPAPRANGGRPKPLHQPGDNKLVQAGLIAMTTLLGWAAVRRRQQARRTAV